MEDGKKSKKKLVLFSAVAAVALILSFTVVFLFTPLGGFHLARSEEPTIVLEIVDGPEWDEGAGMYRIVVKATVSGSPEPTVSFNRNDGDEEIAAGTTVIFLAAGDSFELSASAVNSAGTATASLDLAVEADVVDNPEDEEEAEDEGEDDEGEEPENQNPVISAINSSVPAIYQSESVTFTANVTDPDGDAISYEWKIYWGSDTVVATSSSSSLTWTPEYPGLYEVSLVVRDGKGGRDEMREEKMAYAVVTLSLSGEGDDPEVGESGWIVKDHLAFAGSGHVYVGDTNSNKISRGFLSFDIESAPYGMLVHKVELRMADPTVLGNPSFMHAGPTQKSRGILFMNDLWGARNIVLSDYNHPPLSELAAIVNYEVTIVSISGGSNPAMADALQARLNARDPRFQLRLQFNYEVSDTDGVDDGVRWDRGDIYLKIWYEVQEPE